MPGFSLDNLMSDPSGLVSQLLQSVGYQPSENAQVKTTAPQGMATNKSGMTPQGMELASLLLPPSSPSLEDMFASAIPSEPVNQPLPIPSTNPSAATNKTAATVQSIVTSLMANDPTFRESMGYPAIDPLKADANGWNLPKTGKVNTTGAAERVNARTSQNGVMAVKQEDGSLLLTNKNTDGTFGKEHAPAGSAVPGSITSTLTQLRRTNNPSEAGVLVENINSTIASETANLNKKAIEYSENAVGIPALQQKIFRSEQMDRSSPNWAPGIGDSVMTKQLKGEMAQARSLANNKAQEFLATNPTLGVLNSQKNAAQAELGRIDKLDSQARSVQNARDTSQIARTDALANKQMQEDAKLEDIDRSITQGQRDSLSILNPSLLNTKDPLAYAKEVTALGKNKSPEITAKMSAIDANSRGDDAKLIALAIAGNVDAKTLLYPKGTSREAVDASLANVAYLANPNNISAYLDKTYGKANSVAKSEASKAFMAEDPKGGNAADKETFRLGRIAKAIATERKQVTDNFFGSVTNWQIDDPTWRAAVADTQTSRGTSNFDAVLNTYLGNSIGAEAVAKLRIIQQQGLSYMGAMPDSLFGRPDSSVLQRKIAQKAKDTDIGRAHIALLNTIDLFNPFATMASFSKPKEDTSILDSAGNLK